MLSFDEIREALESIACYPSHKILSDQATDVQFDTVDKDELAASWREMGVSELAVLLGPINQNLCVLEIATKDSDISDRVKKYFSSDVSIVGVDSSFIFYQSDLKNKQSHYVYNCPGNLGRVSVSYSDRLVRLPNGKNDLDWLHSKSTLFNTPLDKIPILPTKWVEELGRLIGAPSVSIINSELPADQQFRARDESRAAVFAKIVSEEMQKTGGRKPSFDSVIEALLKFDHHNYSHNSFFLDPSEPHNKTDNKSINALSYVQDYARSLYNAGKPLAEMIEKPAGSPQSFKALVPIDLKEQTDEGGFSTELIPHLWRGMIEEISESHGMAPQGLFMSMLASLGACLQGKIVIQPIKEEPFFKRPNLAIGLVATSGSKKSDVISIATQELKKIEKRLKNINPRELVLLHESSKHAIEDLKRKRRGEPEKIKEINKHIIELEKELEANPLKGTKFIYENAPIQKMIVDLKENQDNGLIVIKDEMKQIFAEFRKKGNEDARSFYMKGFDGNQTYAYSTIGRGEDYIDKHVLSLITAVQPDVLDDYIRQLTGFMGENDGFIQRILLIPFGNPSPQRPKIVNFSKFEKQYEIFRTAFDKESRTISIGKDFIDFYNECRYQIRTRAMSYHHLPVGSFLSKQEGLLCQLAFLYEFIERSTDCRTITDHGIKRAMKLMDYLTVAAKQIFKIKDRQQKDQEVFAIAELLRLRHFKDPVTVGKIWKNQGMHISGRARLEEILNELERRGYIAREGGLIHVNPEVYLL